MEKLTLWDLEQRLYSETSVPIKITTYNLEEIIILVTKVNFSERTIKGYSQGTIAKINYKNYDKLLNIESDTSFKYYELYSGKVLQSLISNNISLVENSDLELFMPSEFVKIGCDKFVRYGDGGVSWLIYPLYYAEELQLSDQLKQGLVQKLNEIGEAQQDWHEECPVLDIIDPDLAPNYYYSSNQNHISERSKYQWFPSDILVSSDFNLKLLSPIHNLPIKDNKVLYSYILEVFKQMLPGFSKLGLFDEGDQKIQVVFKAQKYVIQPGTSYSGKWHVEGKTENIVAGGVYYCKIDSRFDNDQVLFRPRQAPDLFYAESVGVNVEQEIDVKENSAFVFLNCIPHKFLELVNRTDEPLERLFLNFFIVDPTKPIESTSFGYEAEKALIRLKKFPKVIIEEILSFIIFRPNAISAKELRKKARQDMQNDQTGWGYIHYGNSGDVCFIDELVSKRMKNRFEKIIDSSTEKITLR
ncbi:hypothetical protein SteCoe_16046 [Stentor coeruleus]|uniref:DUF4246 domain-containing protein n=1 Tax=Stentor coeruleus TaxID=5963 RepID=A0A1R2C257_9CILI|nr:hypothetical protein SteCoe_16046 [Stentor coeruleus]